MKLHPNEKNGTRAYCKQMILYKRTMETTWWVMMVPDQVLGQWQI